MVSTIALSHDVSPAQSQRQALIFHNGSEMDRAMKLRPMLLNDGCEAVSAICGAAPSASGTRTGDNIAGGPTFDAQSQSSTETADLAEILGAPSTAEESRCLADLSLVRVMGKQLDTARPQHLILYWIGPEEDEAAGSRLDCHFRAYDEKIS